MTHDPDLVELVARAFAGDTADEMHHFGQGDGFRPQWTWFLPHARAALNAIDASGTHWVAPWEAPDKETSWENTRDAATYDAEELWDMWRDEWLAKQRGAP